MPKNTGQGVQRAAVAAAGVPGREEPDERRGGGARPRPRFARLWVVRAGSSGASGSLLHAVGMLDRGSTSRSSCSACSCGGRDHRRHPRAGSPSPAGPGSPCWWPRPWPYAGGDRPLAVRDPGRPEPAPLARPRHAGPARLPAAGGQPGGHGRHPAPQPRRQHRRHPRRGRRRPGGADPRLDVPGEPALNQQHVPLSVRLLLAAYPPASVFVVAMGVRLSFSSSRRPPLALRFVLLAMGFLARRRRDLHARRRPPGPHPLAADRRALRPRATWPCRSPCCTRRCGGWASRRRRTRSAPRAARLVFVVLALCVPVIVLLFPGSESQPERPGRRRVHHRAADHGGVHPDLPGPAPARPFPGPPRPPGDPRPAHRAAEPGLRDRAPRPAPGAGIERPRWRCCSSTSTGSSW